jgi:hypothetical protein
VRDGLLTSCDVCAQCVMGYSVRDGCAQCVMGYSVRDGCAQSGIRCSESVMFKNWGSLIP